MRYITEELDCRTRSTTPLENSEGGWSEKIAILPVSRGCCPPSHSELTQKQMSVAYLLF